MKEHYSENQPRPFTTSRKVDDHKNGSNAFINFCRQKYHDRGEAQSNLTYKKSTLLSLKETFMLKDEKKKECKELVKHAQVENSSNRTHFTSHKGTLGILFIL